MDIGKNGKDTVQWNCCKKATTHPSSNMNLT